MPRFQTLACSILLAAMCARAETLTPADVKVFGAIDYGETSDAVEHTGTPKFGALIFNGAGKDRVEVTVKSTTGQPFVAIADGSLKQLASGTGKLTFTLPDHGADSEAYYIVFRETDGKAASFTVTLKKVSKAGSARLLYTHCRFTGA